MNRHRSMTSASTAVFFDESAFLMQRQGGVTRYITTLAKCLAATGQISVHIYGGIHSNQHLNELENISGLHVHALLRREKLRINTLLTNLSAIGRRISFRSVRKRHETVIYHPSFYHFDSGIASQSDANAATFYDMIPEWLAQDKPEGSADPIIQAKRNCAEKSDLLLSISEATQKDIHHFYPDLRINSCVTLLASQIAPAKSNQSLPDGISTGKFLLLVGNRSDYKNGETAMAAFARLGALHPNVSLVAFGGEALNDREKKF